jgi:hypothetical protein
MAMPAGGAAIMRMALDVEPPIGAGVEDLVLRVYLTPAHRRAELLERAVGDLIS